VHPAGTPPAGWLAASGERVTFARVPDFVGPFQLACNWFPVRQAVRKATCDAEAVLLRVPCNIGILAWRSLSRGRPYGVEVVGDPCDATAPGALDSRLRPAWRWLLPYYLRRICDGATTAAYVTRYALQRRYPPRSSRFSTSYSDVMTTHYSSITLPQQVVNRTPRLYSPDKNTPTIISIGSMARLYKAQDVLIEACACCIQRGLKLRLVLVGDGKMRPHLETLAREAGIAGHVTFLGQLSSDGHITEALDNADLFVLASRAEGLPRAMIEAMARGLPCIGSDVGGIPELISANALVSVDDAPALAAKIYEVLTDPVRMARMSEENLVRVADYSEEVLRGRREAFYRHLSSEANKWNRRGLLTTSTEGVFVE
jgi:glycosyltransferase involved in cell wall biosynthesis